MKLRRVFLNKQQQQQKKHVSRISPWNSLFALHCWWTDTVRCIFQKFSNRRWILLTRLKNICSTSLWNTVSNIKMSENWNSYISLHRPVIYWRHSINFEPKTFHCFQLLVMFAIELLYFNVILLSFENLSLIRINILRDLIMQSDHPFYVKKQSGARVHACDSTLLKFSVQ